MFGFCLVSCPVLPAQRNRLSTSWRLASVGCVGAVFSAPRTGVLPRCCKRSKRDGEVERNPRRDSHASVLWKDSCARSSPSRWSGSSAVKFGRARGFANADRGVTFTGSAKTPKRTTAWGCSLLLPQHVGVVSRSRRREFSIRTFAAAVRVVGNRVWLCGRMCEWLEAGGFSQFASDGQATDGCIEAGFPSDRSE
jgi:hypothetical protein